MLDPNDRQDIFTILRPPDGYELDRAIGTTFSLDLLALLTVPLAFTFFSGTGEENDLLHDPLALLDGVRRYANRIFMFCQAGQIGIPKTSQQLFTYLESQVFEVAPLSEQGIFHPKVWLLRYQPAADALPGQPIYYRLLCLSRNLTFDRSWDTSLVLDGVLTERKRAYSRNHPLGEFFARLPDLLIRPQTLPDAAASVVDQLQDEVRRVDFELPWGFDDLAFLPLGLTGRRSNPFPNWAQRQLVVSPFIGVAFLQDFAGASDNNILVSRLDSLMSLTADQLQAYRRVYVMNSNAEPEEEDLDDIQDDLTEAPVSPPQEDSSEIILSGLHAKLFICEQGWEATVWTGSANATMAAFSRNVEFLVQLKGKKSRVGIEQFLASGKDGRVGFLDLLVPYDSQVDPVEQDSRLEMLEAEATRIQRLLARFALHADVVIREIESGAEHFAVHIIREDQHQIDLLEQATLKCWPITLQEAQAVRVQVNQRELAVLSPLSFTALTPFFAFEVMVSEGLLRSSKRFVLSIPLHNAPTDRQERILRSLLDNQNKVMRYLLFLLAGEAGELTSLLESVNNSTHTPVGESSNSLLPLSGTLFEALIRTLNNQPEKLDHVAHLVLDLEKAGTSNLLPEGFTDIWLPIWQARQNLQRKNKDSVKRNGR